MPSCAACVTAALALIGGQARSAPFRSPMNEGPGFSPPVFAFVWLANVSALEATCNVFVALGFFCLPILLVPMVRGHRALYPFSWCLGAFLTTCGLLRIVGILALLKPDHWIASALTVAAAMSSFATIATLLFQLPYARMLNRSRRDSHPHGDPQTLSRLALEASKGGGRLAATAGETFAGALAREDRMLADAMPHMVFTATPDGIIDYGNRAWYDYTGLTESQTCAGDWNAVLHPHDLLRCSAAWTHALRNAEPYNVEMRLRRASDGAYRWIICRATPAFDATGAVLKWIGSCTDIHDFKPAVETRQVLDGLGHMISIRSGDGRFEYVSPSWAQLTGTFAPESPDLDWRGSIHPDDLELPDRQSLLGTGSAQHVEQREIRILAADGRYRWFLARSIVLHETDGQARRILETLTDIDELRRLRAAFNDSDLRYRALTDAMPQMIYIIDEQTNIEFVNASWLRYTGLTFEYGMRSKTAALVHPDDLVALANAHQSLRSHQMSDCELRMRRCDGVYRWHILRTAPLGEKGDSATKWVVTATDIDAYKSAQAALANSAAELTHRAHHDALTNLPNRITLMERLTEMIAEAERDGTDVIVLYLDIDHFKSINDTLGHNSGDKLLVATAARINAALRAEDTASRFGGDEFVVICTAAGGEEAPQIAERLALAVREPIELDGKRVVVGSSIGISVFPQNGGNAAELVQKADAAMHAAKQSGRNAWCVYSAQAHLPATVPALEFEAELREAIALEQFVVYYQPIISVETGRPMGAEALVRWAHPKRGLLAPGEFISFAENHGLIAPIGELVLNAACAQLRRLNLRSGDNFTIAVNVSARQFAKPGFVATIATAIKAHDLDARRLEIEITESVVMGDTAGVIATLDELQRLGVKLSIDDFGTGYSSLAYIKNFPIHTLKIDRSFVSDIALNFTDQAIAKTIVTLAHSLGMRVIAEGVETAQQLEHLRSFGADCIQGYLISRPLPAADFEDFLADRRSMVGRALKRIAS